MKTAYLLPIRSPHLANIMNGDKTIEIRTRIPKEAMEMVDRGESVDVYFYCTKAKPYLSADINLRKKDNEIIEEDKYYLYENKKELKDRYYNAMPILNGLIPCKFTLRKYDMVEYILDIDNECYEDWHIKDSCVTQEYLLQYGKGKDLYAIHIEDLEIFDKPMTLHDFHNGDGDEINMQYVRWLKKNNKPEYLTQGLKKAPQTWMRVYVNE